MKDKNISYVSFICLFYYLFNTCILFSGDSKLFLFQPLRKVVMTKVEQSELDCSHLFFSEFHYILKISISEIWNLKFSTLFFWKSAKGKNKIFFLVLMFWWVNVFQDRPVHIHGNVVFDVFFFLFSSEYAWKWRTWSTRMFGCGNVESSPIVVSWCRYYHTHKNLISVLGLWSNSCNESQRVPDHG